MKIRLANLIGIFHHRGTSNNKQAGVDQEGVAQGIIRSKSYKLAGSVLKPVPNDSLVFPHQMSGHKTHIGQGHTKVTSGQIRSGHKV